MAGCMGLAILPVAYQTYYRRVVRCFFPNPGCIFYRYSMSRYLILFLLVGLTSCQSDPTASSKVGTVIARVGEEKLYLTDVQESIPANSSSADSSAFLKRYATAWVRKQLLMEHARTETKEEGDDIEEKIQDYRYYLLTQAFEKQYIEKNLDSTVTSKEIQTYYQKNPESFALQQAIVRAQLVALPKKLPSIEQARTWMATPSKRTSKELQSYCYRFARYYHLTDSVWVLFDEITRKTPFYTTSDRTKFIKNASFAETSDEQNVYLLAVKEYRVPGQPAPLSFVEAQVRDLIINRRKVELIQKLEQKIYEDAQKAKQFEILTQ